MKYIKKFESEESDFVDAYTLRFNQKKKEYKKYRGKYLIIQIDDDNNVWIMKIKRIKSDSIDVFYYSNGSLDNVDNLNYNYDLTILGSFDTFEESYRKYEDIVNMRKNMKKYNL